MERGKDSRIKVFLLEDDEYAAKRTAAFLVENGMNVAISRSVKKFWENYRNGDFDILLLDIMLEDGSGLEVCREIRKNSPIPIVFTTSLDDVSDTVLGLELGGDGYLIKPFSLRELLQRIKTLYWRAYECSPISPLKTEPKKIHFKDFLLDTGSRVLIDKNGEGILLSNAEYQLLRAFLDNPRTVLERNFLLSCFGRTGHEGFDHRLETQISNLRKKLDDGAQKTSCIRTIHGSGYLFTEAPREGDLDND